MVRIFILIFILLSALNSHAAIILRGSGGGEANIELGHTTSTSSTGSLNGRVIPFTVPAGGMTVTHAYAYLSTTNPDTAYISFSIFNSSGTQVAGDCDQSFVVGTSASWVGGALTTPTFLPAGNYYQQYITNGETVTYYREEGCTDCFSTTLGCSTKGSTSSSYYTRMVVANYASR